MCVNDCCNVSESRQCQDLGMASCEGWRVAPKTDIYQLPIPVYKISPNLHLGLQILIISCGF